MPSYCAVINCSYKYNPEKVSFHKFPQHSQRILRSWIDFTQRSKEWQPTRWSSICSSHFISEYYRDCSNRKCLKRNAIPTVNVTRLSETEKDNAKVSLDVDNISVFHECRICIEKFSIKSESPRIDQVEILELTMKCLPSISFASNTQSSAFVCPGCIGILREFAKYIEKVVKAQNYLENSTPLTTSNSMTKTTLQRIKQEPRESIGIKQEINETFEDNLNLMTDYPYFNSFDDTPIIHTNSFFDNCDIEEVTEISNDFINLVNPSSDKFDFPNSNIFKEELESDFEQFDINLDHNYSTAEQNVKDEIENTNFNTNGKQKDRIAIISIEEHRDMHPHGHRQCSKCGKSFFSVCAFLKHKTLNHQSNLNFAYRNIVRTAKKFTKNHQAVIICRKCKLKCNSIAVYIKHRKSCGKNGTKNRQLLNKKVVIHTGSGDENESITFTLRELKLIKQKLMELSKPKLFCICDICGKKFNHKNNLRQHYITHTTDSKYQCGYCGKKFKRLSGKNQHVNSIHFNIKPHECPTCKHKYALRADMLRCRHSKLKTAKPVDDLIIECY